MKTSIIPIFIPHYGCPYRCVFCNQWRITGQTKIADPSMVWDMIHSYTEGVQEKRHWEVAFYGGSFTAIDPAMQEALLAPAYQALQQGMIDAIRCSTRPDCIDLTVTERLKRYGMTIVELGVQSLDDHVLAKAKRGHSAAQVVMATKLLRDQGFVVGHQLMPGLPGEDMDSLKNTTKAIVELHPDMTRIYPVVVIEGTELADMYRRGDYVPLSIHEGVVRAAYMKQAFLEAGIPCIRTGLQATDNLNDNTQVLAGAYTPAMGEMVDSRRYQQLLFSLLRRLPLGMASIYYNRCDTSRVRGIHNVTVKRSIYCCRQTISWHEDNTVAMGTVLVIAGDGTHYKIDTNTGCIQQKGLCD